MATFKINYTKNHENSHKIILYTTMKINSSKFWSLKQSNLSNSPFSRAWEIISNDNQVASLRYKFHGRNKLFNFMRGRLRGWHVTWIIQHIYLLSFSVSSVFIVSPFSDIFSLLKISKIKMFVFQSLFHTF